MRFKDFKFLLEMSATAANELKKYLSAKIKELPTDDATIKTLKEIEDLLKDVNAGGKKGIINNNLESIKDPAVSSAQKEIARFILSLDPDPETRTWFFDLWRNDKIINKDALFSGKHVGFDEVFTGYGENDFVKEFVDDLMNIATLGHGKGEFALSVLSRDINKPKDNKGDIRVKIGGKDLQVEVKTASESVAVDVETGKEKRSKSSARFGDQEVRPAAGWDPAARDLNDFVSGAKNYKDLTGEYKASVPTAGLGLAAAIAFYQKIDDSLKPLFIKKLETVVSLIFGDIGSGRKQYESLIKDNIRGFIKSIESGNEDAAKQYYSMASFNYYMAKKEDDGVLFVDMMNNKFVWYASTESLVRSGLRFHTSTIYLTGVKDPVRTAYPQIYIQPSTRGASAFQQNLKKGIKVKSKSRDEIRNEIRDMVKRLAEVRGVFDRSKIEDMSEFVHTLFDLGTSPFKITALLEKEYPELSINQQVQ